MLVFQLITFALALWVSYTLILSGEHKLAGNPQMVAGFTLVGEHFNLEANLFRRLIGLCEIGGAFLLPFPSTRWIAAAALSVIMLGAIYSHLRIFMDDRGWIPAAKILAPLLILLIAP
jgi:uncharacterized membrane protein YphA (DoxX/SURF4 family)